MKRLCLVATSVLALSLCLSACAPDSGFMSVPPNTTSNQPNSGGGGGGGGGIGS
jgi:hypothetical protein